MPDTGFGQKKPPRRAAERSFIFERKTGPNGPNKKDYSQYRKVTCVAGDSFHEPHHQKANGREPNIYSKIVTDAFKPFPIGEQDRSQYTHGNDKEDKGELDQKHITTTFLIIKYTNI